MARLSVALAACALLAAAGVQGGEPRPWYDEGHGYVTEQAQDLARWMDSFFGDLRADEEAPRSILRLRLEEEWDERDGFGADIKGRGKFYLPNLDKRVSLLLDEDDTGETETEDLLLEDEENLDDLSLQLEAIREERHRLDLRVGLRSSGYPKTSARYRYRHPFRADLWGTASQELFYLTDDGFASETRLELDHLLAADRLLQWHNRLYWVEDKPGVKWATSLALQRRLGGDRALSAFASAVGRTEPTNLVRDYAVGLRFRRKLFRPWLFGEIKPYYRWSKAESGIARENALVVLLRLEVVFSKDGEKGAPPAEEAEEL
ncbi:MAG: hypothetical protein KatS3mg124_0749 [Porticoccaceae bacterium]|nr:MAG: hypothetical protein KatS3mg124_0749 [Porticoccaceae bacterium]